MTALAPASFGVWGNSLNQVAVPSAHIARKGRTSAFNRGILRGLQRTGISPVPIVSKDGSRLPSGIQTRVATPTARLTPEDAKFNVGRLQGANRRISPVANSWTQEKARSLMETAEEKEKQSPEGVSSVMSAEDLSSALKLAIEASPAGDGLDKLQDALETSTALSMIEKRRPLMENELDTLREIEEDLLVSASKAVRSKAQRALMPSHRMGNVRTRDEQNQELAEVLKNSLQQEGGQEAMELIEDLGEVSRRGVVAPDVIDEAVLYAEALSKILQTSKRGQKPKLIKLAHDLKIARIPANTNIKTLVSIIGDELRKMATVPTAPPPQQAPQQAKPLALRIKTRAWQLANP